MILISYLHLEFRSVNCHNDLIFFSVAVQNFCSANFLPIIITSSVVEFILSKIPCFPHILMDTFRRMRLKYENYSLRSISFQRFKQHSDYISLIAKTFDRDTSKIKVTRLIQGIKNKKLMFLAFLDRARTLILQARFFACPIK